MITIIDYGMGNLRSVHKAFERFCSNVIVSSSPNDILRADKIVLPGVGAFKVAMKELKKRRLIEPVKTSTEKGKPFLGICLGLQLLFTESEEGGRVKGLDIIKGKVKRFQQRNGLKIPHMGWNNIRFKVQPHSTRERGMGSRFKVKDGSYMYFVHSYYAVPEDKGVILCETDYGIKFTSGICKDNIFGFQFHPEKSQAAGLRIIENFIKL
jgi:glutamine amidotransferase